MAIRRSASVATPDTAPATTKTNGKTRAPSKSQNKTQAARTTVARLRDEACERARPLIQAGTGPIRVMARIVGDLEAQCRELGTPRTIMVEGIVNRTIGDVDVRRISARDDGAEFVTLADEMGLALPGERFDGYTATGERYRWLHERMLDYERQLLERHIDVRVYDLPALGNPLLREMVSEHAKRLWGFTVPPAQIFLSLGSLDGLDKFWRGYKMMQRARGVDQIAVLFPAPGFNVPEWQAISFGLRLHRLVTRAENGFKITPEELRSALAEAPDLQLFYLTVSSNPTAFAYTPDELRALFAVVRECEREVTIVADLAYIGTGDPAADRARMQTFNEPGVLEHSVLVNSFSKTHTLTGDRLGWVAFGDPQLAAGVAAGWANSMATLPADWQLRYMAIVELYQQHPEIEDKIRALYKLRRERLGRQLQALNKKHHLFAKINLDDGGTVYNWSQLAPGEDVFSLFSKTGIAGVPGGAFGYSDDYVRLSVGCIPVPVVGE
jgi:aspartate/methionine/tyrosine aminotransferase